MSDDPRRRPRAVSKSSDSVVSGNCNLHIYGTELTREHFKDISNNVLKCLFRYLLILWVALGLAGQGAASAVGPSAAIANEQGVAMAQMADCNMGENKTGENSVPCKEMTPGCVAMTGCVTFLTFDPPNVIPDAPLAVSITAAWPAIPVLRGRSVAPEPYPPSRLG